MLPIIRGIVGAEAAGMSIHGHGLRLLRRFNAPQIGVGIESSFKLLRIDFSIFDQNVCKISPSKTDKRHVCCIKRFQMLLFSPILHLEGNVPLPA